jgi:tetratricopeptide (TPR) repeat protein
MFDNVPMRLWLLIAIGAVAYGPAHYLLKHVLHAPSRRDITQPREDLSWRTPGRFIRSAGILALLIGLAIFIFTPAAEQFARSPSFFPVLVGGCGAWALFTVARGLASGQIQPFIRGNYDTYERGAQPKRFWASLSWNLFFGILCLWIAWSMTVRTVQDRCFDYGKDYSPPDRISDCSRLISKPDNAGDNLADALASRGSAYYRMGDYRHAIADYTAAIRLDPGDYYSLYNRALAYGEIGERERAIADYGAAIRVSPRDPYAYLNRGLIFLDTGRFDQAIGDFTRSHELNPKNAWPLANRGITYAWKKDQARAKQDFQVVRTIDSSNPVMLRGEALLALDAGDPNTAVDRLSQSLDRDPDNIWALRMRSEVYLQLGETEKSWADSDKVDQLRRIKKKDLPTRD